jgi:hypothetical protein
MKRQIPKLIPEILQHCHYTSKTFNWWMMGKREVGYPPGSWQEQVIAQGISNR